MLIRGTPKEISDYLAVSNEESDKLHRKGYVPEYMDKDFIYYRWTQDLRNNYLQILGGGKVGGRC